MIHFKENTWIQSDISPPEKGPISFKVVNFKIIEGNINITYGIANEKTNVRKLVSTPVISISILKQRTYLI